MTTITLTQKLPLKKLSYDDPYDMLKSVIFAIKKKYGVKASEKQMEILLKEAYEIKQQKTQKQVIKEHQKWENIINNKEFTSLMKKRWVTV